MRAGTTQPRPKHDKPYMESPIIFVHPPGPPEPKSHHHTPNPSQSNLKRKRAEPEPEPFSIWDLPTRTSQGYSPFLVISPTSPDKKLSSLSVFAFSRALRACGAEKPKSVSRLRTGEILVEVNGPTESRNLLKVTMFGDVPVTVEAHKSLNRSKSVIKSRDLDGCSKEEMVKELDRVVHARRVKIRRGDKVPNRHLDPHLRELETVTETQN